MNQLVKYLIEDFTNKSISIFGGSTKPPTSGHFTVVKKALEQFPDVDEFIICVGSGTRDGVTQKQAIQIWEIYKKYLSNKIKIEEVNSPIRFIYDYAKVNPETQINWILGSRENNEQDQLDIKNRTKSVEKYPNLKPVEINTSGNASGTKARQALSISKEEFYKFIPEELSNEDKEQIYNMLKNQIQEMSQTAFQTVEDYADKELNPLDIEFTKHFFERLVDPRNIKPITAAELVGFFKRLSRKKEQLIDFLKKYREIVVTDNRTDINIPLVKQANSAIAKTIMRKKDFKTPDPKIEMNELIKENKLDLGSWWHNLSIEDANKYAKEYFDIEDYKKLNLNQIKKIYKKLLKENLESHAKTELDKAGLFNKDSDYGGMIGKAVLELIQTMSKQGHSGMSAAWVRELFNKLSNYETLTPITSDPNEWVDVAEYGCGEEKKTLWQNNRNPAIFSEDGGKTWHHVNEKNKKALNEGFIIALKGYKKLLKENKDIGSKLDVATASNQFMIPYEELLNQIEKDWGRGDLYYEIEQAIFDKKPNQIFRILKSWELDKEYANLLNLNEDQIPGGLSDNKTLKNILNHHYKGNDETKKRGVWRLLKMNLRKGIEVESEHTSDPKLAEEITMDHLWEDYEYYTKLNSIGLEENLYKLYQKLKNNPISGFNQGYKSNKIIVHFKDGTKDEISQEDWDKLFKMGKIKKVSFNDLKETQTPDNYKKTLQYLDKLVKHCCEELQIPRPKIIIDPPNYTQQNTSFGGYVPGENKIYLVVKGRNCSDIMRTLSHELNHCKQDVEGVLTNESGMDGSPHENECNAYSGKTMRKFNKEYPEILNINNV